MLALQYKAKDKQTKGRKAETKPIASKAIKAENTLCAGRFSFPVSFVSRTLIRQGVVI